MDETNIKRLANEHNIDFTQFSSKEIALIKASVHFEFELCSEKLAKRKGKEELEKQANAVIVKALNNKERLQQGLGGDTKEKNAIGILLNTLLPSSSKDVTANTKLDEKKESVRQSLDTLAAFTDTDNPFAQAISLGQYREDNADLRYSLLSSLVNNALENISPVEARVKLQTALRPGSSLQAIFAGANMAIEQSPIRDQNNTSSASYRTDYSHNDASRNNSQSAKRKSRSCS